jgi:membrane peptidoglycan carboxypeptidase
MILEYNTGRKDFVLGRMFEDAKITPIEYQSAFIGGLDFQFRAYQENIKYPHFVFYIKDYLENKYGKDFESQGGLKIYTTIDPKLQDKAEELVKKQVKFNTPKYGAKSAALVSMDNKTGQILAMVGGADYFNGDEDGNVNIITSKRQPGSSFKPIVYTLAISKNPIGPDTPVFDLKTKFGNWEPNNYDENFLGKMNVKKALDYSRNIPAIKMFYLAGGEASVVEFAEALGINSLSKDGGYGAPLAIGTGELKPIELLQAYSVFANGGYKKDINPILKIIDKKGNLIEQFTENSGKYVVSDASAYIINTILSDASSRPGDFWNNVLTLKDRAVAAKTGTSNKDVSKGGKKQILPRDLWTAGYTPQITTVVWAGNVDGAETKGTCDGLNCAAPIWHDFMEAAHKNLPKESFQKPESIFSATISQIS